MFLLQGAPVAKCPFRDNKNIANDPERNNNFDYVIRDKPGVSSNEPTDFHCPFNAHTRKTAPRNLEPYINKKYLESGSIVRGGLPYGGEVNKCSLHQVSKYHPHCSLILGHRSRKTRFCRWETRSIKSGSPLQLLYVQLGLWIHSSVCRICGK